MSNWETEEYDIAVAWCISCKEMIGPTHADDVGYQMGLGKHGGHLVKLVDEWTVEVNVSLDALEEEKQSSSGTLGGVR